ncbi:hypothetical protein [Erythrobacter neustonensis]|uniref:hypothetical protein n=1 Tax=Erythrobacter neustonensis TaxID=1112 RepID=UPI001E52EC00|nr:hypothetical protein [Erythrobacter neustonensis]
MMVRLTQLAFVVALAVSGCIAPATAQSVPRGDGSNGKPQVTPAADCRLRINATPTAWIIRGYDPYETVPPEAIFSATFVNDGTAECRFTPIFELAQPPFGLSSGKGKPIGYALINLSDSQDATPRAGRSVRNSSEQRTIELAANERRTVTYRLVASPDEVNSSGTFTQDVILEARDQTMRTLGGARIVLGLEVLPSARIGLAGAYRISDGQAIVSLGELREGPAPVPLQLRVSSTGRYDLNVTSLNSGKLRLNGTEWTVPYSLTIGGNAVNLSGMDRLQGPSENGLIRAVLPIQFYIGDVSRKRAGTYSDLISISVTAR